MQHMQQTRSSSLLQQLEAALTSIPVGSDDFVSSVPEGVFAAVAVKLPKPTPRLPKMMIFGLSESIFLRGLILLNTWFHRF